MHIDPKSEIAGHPALVVRALLRRIGDSSVDTDFIAYHLDTDSERGHQAAEMLAAQGFLAEDTGFAHGGPHYETTLLGNSLALASAAKPLTRKTATRKFDEFMARVHEVNANPYYLYKIKKVVLFGSYLTEREKVNDIDVAVEVGPKYEADEQKERDKQRRKAAQDQGRRFSNFVDEMFWPEIEVMKFLKSRSRAISLHRTSDGILEQTEHQVIYQEGEAEQVGAC